MTKEKMKELYAKEDGRMGSMDLHGLCTNSISVLTIADQDGKVYEFEKPEFECELLKVYKNNKIIGSACNANWDDELQPLIWDTNGIVISRDSRMYDLTPIKKEWYKDESNFPMLMIEGGTSKWFIIESKEEYYEYCDDSDRLATKEEVMSLYWEDK